MIVYLLFFIVAFLRLTEFKNIIVPLVAVVLLVNNYPNYILECIVFFWIGGLIYEVKCAASRADKFFKFVVILILITIMMLYRTNFVEFKKLYFFSSVTPSS